jgi:hypothetical protein
MKEQHLVRSFNLTFRYIDVVLSLNNPRFGDYLHHIYPKRTWIKGHHRTLLGLPRILTYYSKWLITKLYDKHDDVLFRIINFPLVFLWWLFIRSWRLHLICSTVVMLNLLTNMVCPSLPVHLVLALVFGGVRVAHLLLVLCVFSFISYVLLVVFVSVFIASSLSLDSW